MSLEPSSVDGALIVDKPAGPTSHDVVARVRRVAHTRRIGHTGTLDPFATGVLPLLIGRATRLARFYTLTTKAYRAELRLGITTDTYDATGKVTTAAGSSSLPSREQVEAVLERFRGAFDQVPPAFSAKKVEGERAYRKARRAERVALAPVQVEVHHLELVSIEDDRLVLVVECSSGFYVRTLAHDIGQAAGCGAHLAALRRTRSGEFDEQHAVALAELESDPRAFSSHLVPLEALLPSTPVAWTSGTVADRVSHGTAIPLGQIDRWDGFSPDVATAMASTGGPSPARRVRVRDGTDGRLIAIAEIAEPLGGVPVLQPSVVLV